MHRTVCIRYLAARLRVFVSRGPEERGRKASAFSGITEVLGNRSSELVSSSTTWTRFRGRARRKLEIYGYTEAGEREERIAEGACHSDVAAMARTLKPHTDDSWLHATCLDTQGILMIPRLKEATSPRKIFLSRVLL